MTDGYDFDRQIKDAYATEVAPPALRENIRRELALYDAPRDRIPFARRRGGWLLAAAVLLTVVAFSAGRLSTGTNVVSSPAADERELYALVLDTVTRDYSQMPASETARLAERYTSWTERLREAGQLVHSVYLRSAPGTDGLEMVSGVVILRAANRAEVDAAVTDSPHVARGGRISVRRVVVLE